MDEESRRQTGPHESDHVHEMQAGVDYLWCPECGRHVASIRLEPGAWEVQCSRCVGECGLCSCRSAGQCFGSDGAPAPAHIFVAGRGSSKKKFRQGGER